MFRHPGGNRNVVRERGARQPAYRTPEIYLNRMITSVMQQSYPHWELILADATEDHSVEETLTNQGFLTERLPENAETIAADARIHYIHLTENAGIAANTNQALPYARGEYIGRKWNLLCDRGHKCIYFGKGIRN